MSADGFLPAGSAVVLPDALSARARDSKSRVEPEHRRTRQPVRRDSNLAGRHEIGFWTRFDPKLKAPLLQAAEFHGRRLKPFGKVAPRGQSMANNAVAVLRELVRLVDYETGRLEPTIATLAARVGLARDTVVRALKTLANWGFLKWMRRYVETGRNGARGPQVRQTSNAYRLILPDWARRFLGRAAEPAPVPDDHQAAAEAFAAQRRDYQFEDPDDPLGKALRRLDPASRKRDSDAQSETGLG